MVSYTIAVIAIFTILTNCTFLILLVRWKHIRLGIFSSLHMLVTSDISCDLILPIILLIEQFYNTSHYYQFHNENGTKNITPMKCHFRSVLWYYTLFLVPLFNTFIPLLSKSLHYFYYMKCIETKRDEFTFDKSISIISLKESNTSLASLKLNKHTNKLTIFCIICQWTLLPILIVILHVAKHKQSDPSSQSYDLIPCMYVMGLPFNNCNSKRNDSLLNISDAKIDQLNTPLSKIQIDYMVNYNWTESLSSITDKIISRLHEIVRSVRNVSELMTTQSTIHCYSQFTNNRTIIIPINPTYHEFVKPYNDTNLLIQDQLHAYIKKMDINMNIENLEWYAYDNCTESRYIIPLNLYFFSIFVIYFGSICLSIISYAKCRHIYSKISEKTKATNLMKIITKIKIPPCNSTFDKGFNAELVADKDNGSECDDQQSNFNKGQSQYNNKLIDITKRLIFTFRIAILLAVLSWIPLLLHILAQMMFCYQIPNWLTDISYSMMISSLNVRNISNIFMIKWRILSLTTWMKHNRIHPISTCPA